MENTTQGFVLPLVLKPVRLAHANALGLAVIDRCKGSVHTAARRFLKSIVSTSLAGDTFREDLPLIVAECPALSGFRAAFQAVLERFCNAQQLTNDGFVVSHVLEQLVEHHPQASALIQARVAEFLYSGLIVAGEPMTEGWDEPRTVTRTLRHLQRAKPRFNPAVEPLRLLDYQLAA